MESLLTKFEQLIFAETEIKLKQLGYNEPKKHIIENLLK